MFTIPDKGEGANDLQSILFQEQLEILVDGINGRNCVLSGCAVTASGTPNMQSNHTNGAVLLTGVLTAVGNGAISHAAADASNPRIDLVVVNVPGGSVLIRQGTAAANPKPPARTANDVVLAAVYIPANDTTLEPDKFTDMRVMREQGPIVLKKVTTPVIFNNTAVAQTYFTLTVPRILHVPGRQFRVRCGGTMLLNSGTPTVRLVFTYGGTTMFSDISGAAAADVDRNSWDIDVTLTIQGAADETLNGFVAMGIIAAKTAPTTGIGDAWSTASNINSINGSAAVDDSADRDFNVQMTMSVANAANEIAMEYAHAELL